MMRLAGRQAGQGLAENPDIRNSVVSDHAVGHVDLEAMATGNIDTIMATGGTAELIVFGLLCADGDCPVAIEMFAGNTAGPSTVVCRVGSIRRQFGIDRMAVAVDRGLLATARAKAGSKMTTGGTEVHCFQSLLANLSTLCAGEYSPPGPSAAAWSACRPTPRQERVLDVPGVDPGSDVCSTLTV